MGNGINKMDRMCQLHELIRLEQTGTPNELAERLHISRTQLYKMLDIVKEYGVDVRYSRAFRTYHYFFDM
ncbi:MAG: HTH domain-containing protein [Bacteroidales bacterium]|nr:HTH domain-containing protein [Bacteroidales bacterium]